jgi:dolichyl-phosphate-mannose-protein mannosyltransferase
MERQADHAWSASRRAALVLSILKGETTEADAARKHGLSLEEVEDWKRRFLLGAEEALGRPQSDLWSSISRLNGGWTFRFALVTVGLIWIGLRVAYWNGYYTEDAPGYVTDAIWTSLGNFQARDNVNGMNVGTWMPVALPLKVLGKSEIALSIWPLFCSLLGVVSLGALAGILLGRWYGLFAAFLYATQPGDVFFSTVVMPDAIQSGWLSFALFLVVLAFTGDQERQRWRLAAAGVAMGVCHLIRAGDVLFLPVGMAAVTLSSAVLGHTTLPSVARGGLAFLAGWLAVIVLEGLWYGAIAGDFLLRLHVLNRHYGTLDSIRQWGLNHDPHTIPFSVFPPALWWTIGGWWQLNQDQAYHGLIFCWALLAIGGGFVALAVGKPRLPRPALAGFFVALVWFAWPLTYHQFGSQSLTHFVPIHRLSRHLVVYAPGAIFATVMGCFVVGRSAAVSLWSRRTRRLLITTGASLLVLHLYFDWKGEQIAYNAYQRIKGTYARIRERLPAGVEAIVGDPGDLCFFDFWLNPPGAERTRMVAFANFTSCEQLTGGVVLTQSNPGWEGLSAEVIQQTVKRLPCLMQPPPGWQLLYTGHPEKVYLIGPTR